jgi:prophage regulatory protein
MEPDMSSSPEIGFIRLPEVLALSGKSRSSIYAAIKRGEFPAPVKLSTRSSAWIRSEVAAWAASRVKASRAEKR